MLQKEKRSSGATVPTFILQKNDTGCQHRISVNSLSCLLSTSFFFVLIIKRPPTRYFYFCTKLLVCLTCHVEICLRTCCSKVFNTHARHSRRGSANCASGKQSAFVSNVPSSQTHGNMSASNCTASSARCLATIPTDPTHEAPRGRSKNCVRY